jgi:hypothetical protein
MIGASRESVWNPSTNCNGEEKWPDSVTCGESYYTNELYFAPERRVRIFQEMTREFIYADSLS